MKRKWYMWILILMVTITSCGPVDRIHPARERMSQTDDMISEPSVTMPETISAFEISIKVLTAIRNRDYQLLADYVHHEKGIIFSPDSYVDSAMQCGDFAIEVYITCSRLLYSGLFR